MKTYILFLTIMLFSHSSFGQQKCITVDGVDPFTKKKTVETKQISLTGSAVMRDILFNKKNSTDIFFGLKNDTLIVGFNSKCEDCHTSSFSKISLKFSNDSVVNITNLIDGGAYGEKTPFFKSTDNFQKTYCIINQDDLKIYRNYTIKNVRFETVKGSTFDYEPSDKKAKQVVEIADCILNYINK